MAEQHPQHLREGVGQARPADFQLFRHGLLAEGGGGWQGWYGSVLLLVSVNLNLSQVAWISYHFFRAGLQSTTLFAHHDAMILPAVQASR